jgi:RHS repeat-associated protein
MCFLLIIQPIVFAQTLNLVYDQNGNLVTGDGVFRVYNSLNQLWKVYNGSSVSGTLLLQYVYHPVEERVYYKTRYFSGGNETTIYVSENFVRVVNSSGNFDYTYVYHDGVQVAQLLPGSKKEYIHNDHLGSSSVVTNSSGSVIEETSFTPFGDIVEGGEETKYDYTGKEMDDVLGEYDFGARFYDPSRGLFTSADPLIQDPYNPMSLNHYSYVWNNPYGALDPNGKTVVVIHGGIPGWNGAQDELITMSGQFNSDIPVQHFQSGVSANDVKAYKKFIDKTNENQPFVIIGYSWGGGDALRVANELDEQGIAIDSVITIDPYQARIPYWDISPDEAPKGGENYNFYQTNAEFPAGSRGTEKSNMNNLDVGQTFGVQDSITHQNIRGYYYVQNKIIQIVNTIHRNRGSSSREISQSSWNIVDTGKEKLLIVVIPKGKPK